MANVRTPHFKWPFEFAGGSARVIEQGTPAEIEQCAEIILGIEIGERIEAPYFGRDEQAFQARGADPEELREVLAEWEPRAVFDLDLDPVEQVSINGYLDYIRVKLREDQDA